MTDEKKKDNKDRKKLSDEELEDVAGGKGFKTGDPLKGLNVGNVGKDKGSQRNQDRGDLGNFHSEG
jgi:hypothetical protein